jgi:hypothetical protein
VRPPPECDTTSRLTLSTSGGAGWGLVESPPVLSRLLRNSRKTECGAIGSGLAWGACRTLCAFEELAQNGVRRDRFLDWIGVRAAPFALLRNSRKTECGAIGSWTGLGCAPHPLRFWGTRAKRSAARSVAGLAWGARRTLCAFQELAQNGARRDRFLDWGACRTLCAFQELAQNGVRAAPFALFRKPSHCAAKSHPIAAN